MNKNKKTLKEYIAFSGHKFVIEWYYDHKGQSLALNYFENLSDDEQIKALGLFELMGNIGSIKIKLNLIMNKIKFMHLSPSHIVFYVFSFWVVKLL